MFHIIVLVSECGPGGSAGVGRADGEAWGGWAAEAVPGGAGRPRSSGSGATDPSTRHLLKCRRHHDGAANRAWFAARLWGYFAIEPFFLAGESSWPASIGAVALRTSSAKFRWLASSCPAKS